MQEQEEEENEALKRLLDESSNPSLHDDDDNDATTTNRERSEPPSTPTPPPSPKSSASTTSSELEPPPYGPYELPLRPPPPYCEYESPFLETPPASPIKKKQRYLAIEAPPASTDGTPESSQETPIIETDYERLMRLYNFAALHLSRNSDYKNHSGVGFHNLGNTCFMNSTLQAIINTPGIRQFFSRDVFTEHVNLASTFGSQGIISAAFSALVDLYFSEEFTVINPAIFLDAFSYVNRSFCDGRQHDAQEFQTYLLDALHEDTNRVQVRQPFEQDYDGTDMPEHAEDYDSKLSQFSSSPIADLFNFRTVSVVTCSECNTSSATFEDQAQLSLELEETLYGANLHDCLKNYFAEESLKNDSQWNCPRCQQPRNATRQTKIWKMPKTLVIHFKRFSENYDGFFEKNCSSVNFDIDELKMKEYLHEEAPLQNSNFSLYAVTNHYGTMNYGHYTSFIRSGEGWLEADDELISVIYPESTKEAFVLFYTAMKEEEE